MWWILSPTNRWPRNFLLFKFLTNQSSGLLDTTALSSHKSCTTWCTTNHPAMSSITHKLHIPISQPVSHNHSHHTQLFNSSQDGSKCTGVKPRGYEQTTISCRSAREVQGIRLSVIFFLTCSQPKVHDVLGTEEENIAELPGNLRALLLVLPKDDFYKEALAEKDSSTEVIKRVFSLPRMVQKARAWCNNVFIFQSKKFSIFHCEIIFPFYIVKWYQSFIVKFHFIQIYDKAEH